MGKLNESLFSSKDNTWETPQDLFDDLDSVFHFEVDIASSDDTTKCSKYYTIENDGFQYEWKETCWCNPPYGREQQKWIRRISEQTKKYGNTIVCLIPARPDTKIWHEVIFPNAHSICFIKGRLKFGGCKDSAPFPSAIIVFGNTNEEQEKMLKKYGVVVNII